MFASCILCWQLSYFNSIQLIVKTIRNTFCLPSHDPFMYVHWTFNFTWNAFFGLSTCPPVHTVGLLNHCPLTPIPWYSDYYRVMLYIAYDMKFPLSFSLSPHHHHQHHHLQSQQLQHQALHDEDIYSFVCLSVRQRRDPIIRNHITAIV